MAEWSLTESFTSASDSDTALSLLQAQEQQTDPEISDGGDTFVGRVSILVTFEATKQIDTLQTRTWQGGQPELVPESAPTDGAMRAMPAHCSTEDFLLFEKEVHTFSRQVITLFFEIFIGSPPSFLQGQHPWLVVRPVLHVLANASIQVQRPGSQRRRIPPSRQQLQLLNSKQQQHWRHLQFCASI